MCLEVEKLLLVGDFLQPCQLPLLVMNLVLHELLDGPHIVLNDMLVSVDMRKIVYFLSLESFLFLSGSLLLLPPLLSEVIEPLGNVTWVGPGPIVASDLALFGLSPLLKQ